MEITDLPLSQERVREALYGFQMGRKQVLVLHLVLANKTMPISAAMRVYSSPTRAKESLDNLNFLNMLVFLQGPRGVTIKPSSALLKLVGVPDDVYERYKGGA